MINSSNRLKGMVTVTVLDENGKVKKIPNNLIRKLFRLPEKEMIFRHHNTITNQGDGLIADWMLSTPTQTKVDATVADSKNGAYPV